MWFHKISLPILRKVTKNSGGMGSGGGGWRGGIKGLDSKYRKSILSGVLHKSSTTFGSMKLNNMVIT